MFQVRNSRTWPMAVMLDSAATELSIRVESSIAQHRAMVSDAVIPLQELQSGK